MVLILCYGLLVGCSSQSSNKYISNQLGINIPADIEIKLNDTHGGVLGDGTTFANIEFEDEIADKIQTEIKENDNWNKLPLSENLQLIMYGGTKGTEIYLYNLAEEVGIPTIQHGYWIFIDRYDDKDILNQDNKIFDRGSFNFTLRIYDIDNNVLYYYEFDT